MATYIPKGKQSVTNTPPYLEMESNSKPLAVLLESQSEADNLYLLGRAPGDEWEVEAVFEWQLLDFDQLYLSLTFH